MNVYLSGRDEADGASHTSVHTEPIIDSSSIVINDILSIRTEQSEPLLNKIVFGLKLILIFENEISIFIVLSTEYHT